MMLLFGDPEFSDHREGAPPASHRLAPMAVPPVLGSAAEMAARCGASKVVHSDAAAGRACPQMHGKCTAPRIGAREIRHPQCTGPAAGGWGPAAFVQINSSVLIFSIRVHMTHLGSHAYGSQHRPFRPGNGRGPKSRTSSTKMTIGVGWDLIDQHHHSPCGIRAVV